MCKHEQSMSLPKELPHRYVTAIFMDSHVLRKIKQRTGPMNRRKKTDKKPFIPLRPRVLYIDMRFSQLASHPKVQLSIGNPLVFLYHMLP